MENPVRVSELTPAQVDRFVVAASSIAFFAPPVLTPGFVLVPSADVRAIRELLEELGIPVAQVVDLLRDQEGARP